MPRFSILFHNHPFPHWDLLLENGQTCRTWRLFAEFESAVGSIPAEEIPDHRMMYLDYEGPVSGDRGTVSRRDHGTFEWQSQSADLCEIRLSGARWQGVVHLIRNEGKLWKCIRVT